MKREKDSNAYASGSNSNARSLKHVIYACDDCCGPMTLSLNETSETEDEAKLEFRPNERN